MISDQRTLSTASERAPRLVLVFAVLTALGVAIAGAVILVLVRHMDTAQVQRQAIDRARFAAEGVLRPELRAVDLSTRSGPRRERQLDRLFERRVLLDAINAGALYGARGRVTYATDGAAAGDPARVREALAGEVVSEVTTRGGARFLQTYIPVALDSGRIAGVVRLDQSYEHIESTARRFSWLIAAVLEGLLLLLFVAFLPVLARVSARIRDHVAAVERLALHDELTGLPNRLRFRRAVEEALRDGREGAVALLDVDGFSETIETLGLSSADALLVQIAERLEFDLDDAACFARLGEDEFGVLLLDAGRPELDDLTARVERSLAGVFDVGGVRVAVTMSVGAALLEPGLTFDVVFGRATTALSHAKSEGQTSPQVCGAEVDLRDISRLAFVAELRDALADGQFLVYYQPQSDLSTRRIRGVEALLRWDHPHDGLLAAEEFIDYAERGGLSRDIRHFVLESALDQWQSWSELDLDLELSVNLGPVDVLDPTLPDEIAQLLDRSGIPPRRLIVEITERTLIADERRARRVVDRLADLGVRIAVDDFGTGYSSLLSLRRFAIHQVKLDRCLLAGVPGDPAAEAIIGGCVEIAHGVGATVVAEGIETPEQWQFASLMGCDVAQGFLVGRPAPPEEVTRLLDAPNHVPLTVV